MNIDTRVGAGVSSQQSPGQLHLIDPARLGTVLTPAPRVSLFCLAIPLLSLVCLAIPRVSLKYMRRWKVASGPTTCVCECIEFVPGCGKGIAVSGCEYQSLGFRHIPQQGVRFTPFLREQAGVLQLTAGTIVTLRMPKGTFGAGHGQIYQWCSTTRADPHTYGVFRMP